MSVFAKCSYRIMIRCPYKQYKAKKSHFCLVKLQGTIRSLSARLEAAMGREAALRQRLSRAEAGASTLATREPSPRVEIPAEQLVTATESSTETPVQVQSTAKAHEENGTEAEPPSSPDAETADDEASQQ